MGGMRRFGIEYFFGTSSPRRTIGRKGDHRLYIRRLRSPRINTRQQSTFRAKSCLVHGLLTIRDTQEYGSGPPTCKFIRNIPTAHRDSHPGVHAHTSQVVFWMRSRAPNNLSSENIRAPLTLHHSALDSPSVRRKTSPHRHVACGTFISSFDSPSVSMFDAVICLHGRCHRAAALRRGASRFSRVFIVLRTTVWT